MKVDCISDLHGYYPKLEGGDLLIVAGDLTARDTENQHDDFFVWINNQPYKKKIFIAGNHDNYIQVNNKKFIKTLQNSDLEYLCDSGTEYENLKIWGSPWTPTFCNWHFMKDRGKEIKAMWDLIPDDIDILITHGPPFGVLDKVKISSKGNAEGFAGCEELRKAIERIQPKLHVFGHIHEGYGQMLLKCTPQDIICVNAAIMNEDYEPVNKPITVIL